MDGSLHLTAELVRLVYREVADQGPVLGSVVFSEVEYDAYLSDFLKERPSGPLYVFCYGSLIWKPVFAPIATAPAMAHGWHRSFCLRVARFRGTPEQPGLMMQIDRGGQCQGLVQQVNGAQEWADLSALWRREMTNKPPSNLPRWVEVELADGPRRAIAFTANPHSPIYAGPLPPHEVAAVLAQACGHWGSCADYLLQTVLSLQAAGIYDSYLWDLQQRVAGLIEARYK